MMISSLNKACHSAEGKHHPANMSLRICMILKETGEQWIWGRGKYGGKLGGGEGWEAAVSIYCMREE